MASQSSLLQQKFLIELFKQKRAISVFLTNGIKLIGIIVNFDDDIIILKGNQSQLVYQHAISSILPAIESNLPRVKIMRFVKKYESQIVETKQTN